MRLSRITAALASTVLCLLMLGPPAHAAFPGANGKVAFVRGGDIWTMNPDGTNQVNVTNDTAAQGSPAWSPDGRTLAFTQGGRIWKMLADGSGRADLSYGGLGSDWSPSWSPDGQQILYASCCPPGFDYTLETMNADGTARTVLASNGREFDATDWASDGSKAWDEGDFCGGARVLLTTYGALSAGGCGSPPRNSYDPSWAPDSQRVAYVLEDCDFCGTNQSIYTVKRDGTDRQQLTTPVNVNDRNPAWSPDGSKIAFDRHGRIDVMNADGTGIVDLTDGIQPSWQPIPLSYVRPKGATPTYASLVPAYVECTNPDTTHGGPLAFPSCTQPTSQQPDHTMRMASPNLGMGTPDANGAAANFTGFVRLNVHPDNPATPADEADVQIKVATADIRCASTAPAAICGSTNVSATSDYVGELEGRIGLRITDKDNTPSPGGAGPGTVSDTVLAFTVPCTQTSGPFTPDTTIGSSCNLSTTVNSVYPGAVVAGKRAIWQLGPVKVYDGGTDGLASTSGDNTLFLDQGVFVP